MDLWSGGVGHKHSVHNNLWLENVPMNFTYMVFLYVLNWNILEKSSILQFTPSLTLPTDYSLPDTQWVVYQASVDTWIVIDSWFKSFNFSKFSKIWYQYALLILFYRMENLIRGRNPPQYQRSPCKEVRAALRKRPEEECKYV